MAKKFDPIEMIATSPLGRAIGNSAAGRSVATKLGVPPAAELRRGRKAPAGPIVLGTVGAGDGLVARTLTLLGIEPAEPVLDTPDARTADENGKPQPPRYAGKIGALVLDLTGLTTVAELEQVRAMLRPAVRALEGSGRLVLVGRVPETMEVLEARAVQQGLDGLNRTLAKELRAGATSNLVWLDPATSAEGFASTLSFLLDGRSAYVDGQSWRVDAVSPEGLDVASTSPYADRIVVVTGAARGIGEAIARTFARDGATVVCVDVPAAGDALSKVANEIRGTALQLDITGAEAGATIAAHVSGRYGADKRIHAIIHNAGITRDRMLANLDEKLWGAVLEVNLAAQLRMNAQLLDGRDGGIADGGAIVGISSTSGIAGNKGQANYATSKAAVIGMVRAMAPELASRGITVNAVGPGFIETDMTAAIPFVQREIFKRSNSLQQGGKPVDVAETIAYLASPASAAVTGQVIRVCGQALVGQ
ncbi:MAG TPA: 3-oxoacyl-ACP reductase [Propionibacteriaceae bacterium]|nr:3-oxoacyl-ACP reductase [Propionibacteriaceae bacterium]